MARGRECFSFPGMGPWRERSSFTKSWAASPLLHRPMFVAVFVLGRGSVASKVALPPLHPFIYFLEGPSGNSGVPLPNSGRPPFYNNGSRGGRSCDVIRVVPSENKCVRESGCGARCCLICLLFFLLLFREEDAFAGALFRLLSLARPSRYLLAPRVRAHRYSKGCPDLWGPVICLKSCWRLVSLHAICFPVPLPTQDADLFFLPMCESDAEKPSAVLARTMKLASTTTLPRDQDKYP